MITMKDLEDMGYSYYDVEVPTDKKTQTPADMVEEFAKVTQQEACPDTYRTLINEEHKEWVEACYTSSEEHELKELADKIYVEFGYARVKGWDLMEALRRVHENNLGRCVQPDGSVRRRDDGKILKNKDYPKVDLGDLV